MPEENKEIPDLVTDVNADGLLIQSADAIRQANETIQTNEAHLKRVRAKRRELAGEDLAN